MGLGVTLLLSDSTNASTPGYSKSESAIDGTLNDMISKHIGRVIIATFASNIYRIKHIVESCKKYNRKIIVFGRSMENSIELALNNDLISDKSIFIDVNDAKSLKRMKYVFYVQVARGATRFQYKDRKFMSQDGILITILNINTLTS